MFCLARAPSCMVRHKIGSYLHAVASRKVPQWCRVHKAKHVKRTQFYVRKNENLKGFSPNELLQRYRSYKHNQLQFPLNVSFEWTINKCQHYSSGSTAKSTKHQKGPHAPPDTSKFLGNVFPVRRIGCDKAEGIQIFLTHDYTNFMFLRCEIVKFKQKTLRA